MIQSNNWQSAVPASAAQRGGGPGERKQREFGMIINEMYLDIENTSTKEKIMGAAISLLLQNGYERTTTAAIAKKAGVNEVSVFRIFGNKQALFNEVYSRLASGPRRISMGNLTGGEDLAADFEYLFSRYLMIQILHIPALRMYRYNIDKIANQAVFDEYLKSGEMMHDQLRGYLEELQDHRVIIEIDCEALTNYLLSLFETKAPEFLLGWRSDVQTDEVYDEVAFRQYIKNCAVFMCTVLKK